MKKTFYIDLFPRYEVEAESKEEALALMRSEGAYPNNSKNGPNGIWVTIHHEEISQEPEDDSNEEDSNEEDSNEEASQ